VANFETRFLKGADDFIAGLDRKSAMKLFYNIESAEQLTDRRLFKKLQGEIWEFRSQYLTNQYRLLAFWDKTDPNQTLVWVTHGFIKKVGKVPQREINKAEKIRREYFRQK
jgi:phage-related protein